MTTLVFATFPGGERRLAKKIVQRENGQTVIASINFRGQIARVKRGPVSLEKAKEKVTQDLGPSARDIQFKTEEAR
jgi:hypothetical protein